MSSIALPAVPLIREPESRKRLSLVRRYWGGIVLAAAALGYLAIQLGHYPSTIGIKDESTYLSQAYVLRAGTIFADVAHIPVWAGIFTGGHVVPMYPPGEAVLLLPVTLIDWHLIFAVNVALQVVAFLLFINLLKRFGVRREWAVLFLFFPALVLFSRTVMTEIPSVTLTLVALLFYFRGGRFRIATGLLFGILELVAYKNLITFALLLLSALLRDVVSTWSVRRCGKQVKVTELNSVSLMAGFVPVFLIVVAYNVTVVGRIFGYGDHGFSLQFILPNLRFYSMDLLILYPLMLFAPLFYRGAWRLEIVSLTFGVLLVTSSYYYIDDVHGFAENLLTGARLLLPVIPVWLLAYAASLDQILVSSRRFGAIITAVATGGAIVTLAVSLAHQQHLQQAAAMRSMIYANTGPRDLLLIDDEAAKFITPAWGKRMYEFLPNHGQYAQPIDLASPISVVYATQGHLEADAFSVAERTAERLGAARLLDREQGDWRIVIWRRAPA